MEPVADYTPDTEDGAIWTELEYRGSDARGVLDAVCVCGEDHRFVLEDGELEERKCVCGRIIQADLVMEAYYKSEHADGTPA